MVIHEACAWGDYVAGEVYSLVPGDVPGVTDTVPFKGNLTVIVSRPDGKVDQYSATAGDDGVFIARNVPLKNGDKVKIKLPDVPNPSPELSVTIPFREVKLYAADYFTGVAEGIVAGSRSKWAKLAGAQQGAGARAAVQGPGARGTLSGSTRTPVNIPSSAGKALANRGTVNNPLGMFSVSGLTLEPGQRVKARIEVEGFTVESEWIETDGLMVSSIEHGNFSASVRPGSETFSADSSFVVVSAIRGEKAPEGTVMIIRGAVAPHASLTSPQAVPELPDARKAKVWFRKEVTLVPLAEHPGTAIASTGPWSVAYGYSSPGDAINPLKNRKHPFEMVTYVYKGKNLGYSIVTDECVSCTAPANVIDRIGSDNLPGKPSDTGRPATVHTEPGVTAVKPGQLVRQPVVIK